MNHFGKPQWTFTLDRTVFFDDKGKLPAKLFGKERKLFLYLLPNSSHPSGIYKGPFKGNWFWTERPTARFVDQQGCLIQGGYDPAGSCSFVLQELPVIQLHIGAAPIIKYLWDQIRLGCYFSLLLVCPVSPFFIHRGRLVANSSNFSATSSHTPLWMNHLQFSRIYLEEIQ